MLAILFGRAVDTLDMKLIRLFVLALAEYILPFGLYFKQMCKENEKMAEK